MPIAFAAFADMGMTIPGNATSGMGLILSNGQMAFDNLVGGGPHTHPIGEVVGLTAALGALSSAVSRSWDGLISSGAGDGNPQHALGYMLHNPTNATPTNIGTSVARCSYFKLPAALTFNRIRYFGVGATSNVYRVAVYRNSDRIRLTAELPIVTSVQAWGSVGNGLNVSLSANTLYFIAVSVNATGTTAGLQCLGGTTGRIGVLPTAWPGNMNIDTAAVVPQMAFSQFSVTAGALPATAPALAAQGAWTGGMPAFFLDNNNA